MDPLWHLAAAALNRGIRESATARAQVAELEGRSLGVKIDPPGLRLRIAVVDGQVGVIADDQPADADLSGGPMAFRRLWFDDPESALRTGAVKLRGDTEIAERFQELLQTAGPDVEELLARVFGDVAGREISQAARGMFAWAGQVTDSMSRSLTEYLQEERRDTPTRFEVDEFLHDVDTLANDIDRATARADRLRQRMDS